MAGLTSSTTKSSNVGDCLKGNTDNADSVTSKILCLEDLKNPDNRKPAVGECMATGAELHLAPCAKGAAKILGQADGLSKTVEEICKDFPDADQAASWSMQGSLAVTTFCMQTIKK